MGDQQKIMSALAIFLAIFPKEQVLGFNPFVTDLFDYLVIGAETHGNGLHL